MKTQFIAACTVLAAVRSVNGPRFTVVRGQQVPGITHSDGAIRCVYQTNGASFLGFKLTTGATQINGLESIRLASGGALWCESLSALVSDCVLAE